MADDMVMRGTDGRLYKVPADVAEKHALDQAEADKLFGSRGVTQHDADQVPDFHVLLQTEYADR